MKIKIFLISLLLLSGISSLQAQFVQDFECFSLPCTDANCRRPSCWNQSWGAMCIREQTIGVLVPRSGSYTFRGSFTLQPYAQVMSPVHTATTANQFSFYFAKDSSGSAACATVQFHVGIIRWPQGDTTWLEQNITATTKWQYKTYNYPFVGPQRILLFSPTGFNHQCPWAIDSIASSVDLNGDGSGMPEITIAQISGSDSNCLPETKIFRTTKKLNPSTPLNVKWRVNGVVVQNGPDTTFSSASLCGNDVVDAVLTGYNPCAGNNTTLMYDTSNAITIKPCKRILVQNVTPDEVCQGGTINIPYVRSANCEFPVGITFQAQMANNKSFTSPIVLGSGASPIVATISTSTPAGKYYIRVLGSDGTISKNLDSIVVNALPNADAGLNVSVCSGKQVTLTATGGTSYAWNNGVIQGVPFTPVSTTLYTVTVTDAKGCAKTDTVRVTVNSNPTADAGPNQSGCLGSEITLTATGGGTYIWSGGISQGVPFTITGTTTYIVTVTNAFGCTATDDVLVTALPLPAVDAGTDISIPYGTSTTLNATASHVSYLWSPADSLINANIEDPQTKILRGSVIFTLEVADSTTGCKNSDQVTVTVTGGPLYVIAQANFTSVCLGNSVQLNALGGGGSGMYTYSWTSVPAGFTSNQMDPSVNPIANTSYIVEIHDGFTSQKDTIDITVFPLPSANAGNDTAICSGQPITLTATGGVTYVWSNGVTQGVSFVPLNTQSYTVTVTDANGCKNHTSVTVTVHPLPAANAGTDQDICRNDTATLSASGGVSYVWSNGATTAVIKVSPAFTTMYTVTVTNANNCSNTDNVTVNIRPPANADAGPNDTICLGEVGSLNASGGVSFYWNTGSTFPNPLFSPMITTMYYVTVTNSYGCTGYDSAAIVVNPLPTVYAGADTIVNYYSPAYLHGTAGGASGIYSYLWTPVSLVLNSTAINSLTVFLTAPQIFAFKVTDALTGCYSEDNMRVNIQERLVVIVSPDVRYTLNIDTAVCLNDSITLFGKAFGGSGEYVFTWTSNPPGTIGSLANITVSPKTETFYYLQVYDSVRNYTVIDTILVKVRPVPVAIAGNDTSAFEREEIRLYAEGGKSYVWTPSDLVVDDPTSQTPLVKTDKDVYFVVKAFNEYGCYSKDSTLLTVKFFEIFVPEAFTPNGDGNNDVAFVETKGIVSIDFKVYNRWGENVFETKDPKVGWDGSYKGKIQHTQTFGWTLKAVDFKGKEYEMKGTITIFR